MTNLTSEQYRDILHHVENFTKETPNVLNLLRQAVILYYDTFGCYPDIGGVSPGKVGIFGEQTQFDKGLALMLTTSMATVAVGRKTSGNRVTVITSADVGKPHKVSFKLTTCPLVPSCPQWINHIKGVMANYCRHEEVPAFNMAIYSNIPMGVGFGSTAALEVAVHNFMDMLLGRKSEALDKALDCQRAEKQFLNKNVGLLDRLHVIAAKDRSATLVNTETNEIEYIPFRNKEVVFIALNTTFKDLLCGPEYPERSKCLEKACEILGVPNLRTMTPDDLIVLEESAEELFEEPKSDDSEWTDKKMKTMIKRARFYITEMQRIGEAIAAWQEGDVETFGTKMTESHKSLRDDFEFTNPVSELFVEGALRSEGVLGAKMIGMGLEQGGSVLILLYRRYLEDFCEYFKKFIEDHAHLLQNLMDEYAKQKLLEREGLDRMDLQGGSDGMVGNFSGQFGVPEAGLQGDLTVEMGDETEDGTEVKKKKKKCDPSAKRKKRKEREEYLKLLALTEEEEEDKENNEPGVETGTSAFSKGAQGKSEKGNMLNSAAGGGTEGGMLGPRSTPFNQKDDFLRGLGTPADFQTFQGPGALEPHPSVEEVKPSGGAKIPEMYIVNPIAGARKLDVLKSDLYRSRRARPIHHFKRIVNYGIGIFRAIHKYHPTVASCAPGSLNLFGEFLEFNKGYVISMALPLMISVVGGRNDSVVMNLLTLSTEVGETTTMRAPVPAAGPTNYQNESWINYTVATASQFPGFIPGFNGVVHSNLPCELGLNSCAAYQVSLFNFFEGFLEIYRSDYVRKAELCKRAEEQFMKTYNSYGKCSVIRYIPTMLCKEGYLILINCKSFKMAHYYLDHPRYVFILAICKEVSSTITRTELDERLSMCQEGADILEKDSLADADESHIQCLIKRDASDEVIKRARYVISEQNRCREAIKAIKNDDYHRLGLLMTESHCSLRDDFEVSSPEIEVLVNLAMSAEGVLGAKMVGKGLVSSVLILTDVFSVDNCLKHIRKNYKPKRDKPFFYVFKPSMGAFPINLEYIVEVRKNE